MKCSVLGYSALGRPIPIFEFGSSKSRVLILGGVHGNETEGTTAAWGLFDSFLKDFTYDLTVYLIPQFNIDGVIEKSRLNGNGVDLNRNLPTQDWNPRAFNAKYPPGPFPNSETESRALIKFLQEKKPQFILSLHSWHPMLNVNGPCLEEAAVLHKWTGYPIEENIGYPTPGCLGTYAGLERDMPTLTYEIQRGLSAADVLRIHVPAIREALKVQVRKK